MIWRHIPVLLLLAPAATGLSQFERPAAAAPSAVEIQSQALPGDPGLVTFNLKRAARDAFAQADVVKARRHLQALHDIYRRLTAADRSDRGLYRWSTRLAEVTQEYLRAGELQDAMGVLGEAAALDVPQRDGYENGLASAAGGLYRRLVQLDADERYQLLHEWSLPTELRNTVLVLTSTVPNRAPPSVFARALGERPRATSFPIASVGELPGLLSTARMLVQSAEDAGRLGRLIRELTELSKLRIVGADSVLTLARIADASGPDEQLVQELEQHLAELRREQPPKRASRGAVRPGPIWQFGYVKSDADPAKVDFKPLPHWTGSAFQGAAVHPDQSLGWLQLDARGGHPERLFSTVRRWVAPTDGTLSVTGELYHAIGDGDGVRGRIVSGRSGVRGEWTARNRSTPTAVDSLTVQAGDTIDFVTDKIDNAAHDRFHWQVRLNLTTETKAVLTFDSTSGFHGPAQRDVLAEVVLAAACMDRDWLQPIGEGILEQLIVDTYHSESWLVRPFLRRAHATAIQQRYRDVSSDLINNRGRKHWVAASGYDSAQNARGAPQAVWLAHEDHILHLTGPRNDCLLFRYPLTGAFEFSCEAQDGGRGGTEGGVTYGGLSYEAGGAGQSFKVWDADFSNEILLPCPFVRVEPRRPTFNRVSLTSTADQVTFASNGHPFWSDTSNDRSSPWVGLRSFNDRRPIFRNIRITGNSVIPREVRMSDGDRLSGWIAAYYHESMPTPLPLESRPSAFGIASTSDADWFSKRGVIHGTHRPSENDAVSQGRLSYFRPLLDGESIRYEFLYEPRKYAVHPALGRLAFLIEPKGVRLHWMTDGESEWTGLTEDNVVIEPFDRRGPKTLPLVTGDWNRMTMALHNGSVTLTLNGTKIYQRRLEPQNETESGNKWTFGLYHDRHQSAVRVRNVVMRGDWPEQLPDELLGTLVASQPDQSPGDRHVINAIFEDRFIAQNVVALRRRVALMPREDQFDALVKWVLPGRNHPTLRMAGEFTSTHPVPFVRDHDAIDASRFERALRAGKNRIELGGNLAAPVFDLVDLAKQLDRLTDLRERVAATTSRSQNHASAGARDVRPDLGRKRGFKVVSKSEQKDLQRATVAMLVLIDIALGDFERASDGIEQLLTLVEESKHTDYASRWPETLALWRGSLHPKTRTIAAELLRSVYLPRIRWENSGSEAWDNYAAAMSGLHRYLELEDTSLERFWTAPGLTNWVPVSFTNFRTRGEGRPRAHWHWDSNRVDNLSGHEQDYLYYRIPLRGNYEVECDVSPFSLRESHLMVAGTIVSPQANLKSYGLGNFREVATVGRIEPKLNRMNDWIRYRTVVRDGVSTTYFNGRKVHAQELPADNEPWLAIRSWSRHQGAVRDLRISGQPVVPEQIQLTSLANLPGWASYFGATVAENNSGQISTGQIDTGQIDTEKNNSDWRQLGDLPRGGGIVGKRRPDLAGSGLQRLLRYHRPMVEDGTIEYDFYYRPLKVATHPALDRLAFMLDPGGVRVHWITDGKYDKTGLNPTNLVDEPDNRRGPEELPLKTNDWNRLRLTLRGDTVDLELNGQLVYRRELEPTNQRTFGLFHFADRTEARVRNIAWRGDWPRTVPAIADQELAGEMADSLDERIPELTSVFEHDFTSDGLPEKYFRQYGEDSEKCISPQGDGVQVIREGAGIWSRVSFGPRFRARGDFDITASFERLETRNPSTCNVQLLAILESQHHCRTTRGHHKNGHRSINGQLMTAQPDGGRRTRASQQTCEADSGRLRLARRGDKIYFLFAEGDSPVFRIIGTQTATADDVAATGVRLVACAGEGARTSVVWKHLSLRAEELTFLPGKNFPRLQGSLRR